MVQLMRMVERIAASGVDTLVAGESGTGVPASTSDTTEVPAVMDRL